MARTKASPSHPATIRLDLALIERHAALSRRKARDVVEKGQVSVDGETVLEPGRAVPRSAEIRWDPNRPARRRARIALPVLYEDESVLVVDKPAGLLSVPTLAGSDEDTALRRVADYVRHLRPRHPYVGRVHRIDRDTSGALAFALTREARQGLIALFRRHEIERCYAAVVVGRPRADSGVVDAPLREAYEGGKRAVARPGEPSAPALTHWRVLERFHGAALLEVRIETGRQHQIRVHLAHAGLPILGDRAYGPPHDPVPARRQMLHARLLGFRHPVTGREVRVESPLPEDVQGSLRALRRLAGGPRA